MNRFARAIVSGRYPNVNQALPDFRRELARVTPGLQRTEDAIAWRLLCRAYDFGLPRRMRFWTDQEKRLLERHALALARGECPDVTTAVRRVNRAFKQAGLAVRHPDQSTRSRILARARALGLAPCAVPSSPEEDRVIDRFSRALVRNEYPYGTAAVADCRRALARAGITHRRSDKAISLRINARARALGFRQKSEPWSASGVRIIDRFAQAYIAGRYTSLVAATRACLPALKHAGQLGNRPEGGLRAKLRVQVLGMGQPGSRPRWSGAELRILNRSARAVIRGAYPTVSAAVPRCRRALERAGLMGHARDCAVLDRLQRTIREYRPRPAGSGSNSRRLCRSR